jgi:putative hemolysin
MAIVVDEFGGIAGIVTLKQLVEEVVGPVGEEGAGPEGEFTAVDENTFVVDAGMRVDEANEQLDVGIPAGEYDTLAGFVLDQLGHIPLEGEHLHHGELRIEVTTMDKVRIVDLRVSREPKLSPMDDS